MALVAEQLTEEKETDEQLVAFLVELGVAIELDRSRRAALDSVVTDEALVLSAEEQTDAFELQVRDAVERELWLRQQAMRSAACESDP